MLQYSFKLTCILDVVPLVLQLSIRLPRLENGVLAEVGRILQLSKQRVSEIPFNQIIIAQPLLQAWTRRPPPRSEKGKEQNPGHLSKDSNTITAVASRTIRFQDILDVGIPNGRTWACQPSDIRFLR